MMVFLCHFYNRQLMVLKMKKINNKWCLRSLDILSQTHQMEEIIYHQETELMFPENLVIQ